MVEDLSINHGYIIVLKTGNMLIGNVNVKPDRVP